LLLIDINYLPSLVFGCGKARLNPPEKLFGETLKAKIALCAIALNRSVYKNFDR
jgi:hypothetical protein